MGFCLLINTNHFNYIFLFTYLQKPKGFICVPLQNGPIYQWQHPLEALDFIQTTYTLPQKCPLELIKENIKQSKTTIFTLFFLPILLIIGPLIIGILFLLKSHKWNELHWAPSMRSSMLAYEPLVQETNRNEENICDNV